jgi:hypothetical protein
MNEFPQRKHVSPGVAIVQMNHDSYCQTFTTCRQKAVRLNLKDRDEDLALIDRFLMPMAIVTSLLAIGSGLLICFLVW